LDTIAQPNGKAGVRSKRNSSSSRTLPREPQTRAQNGGDPPAGVDGAIPVAVNDLVEALARSEQERVRASELLERAEEDLSSAHRRLDDADAARRHLLDNVASGGDEARRRFASVLHDDVLQQLTAAELQLERISVDAASTRYAAPLADLKGTMRLVEESLRNLLYNVSPPQDVQVNLSDAIRDRLLALKAHTGIEPDLDIRLPKRTPDALRAIVYRNISEAINNVEKHANATRVSVKAAGFDGGIQVEIADDGSGFVVSESLYLPGHLGLVAMRERAQLAGGWCRFESEPGTGTRVTFWIPGTS
jgi:signal transduction histidine kinase